MATAAFAIVLSGYLVFLVPSAAWASVCPAGGEHDYSVTILRAATETEDGLRQYTCTKCGDTFTNAIPATGHRWSEWVTEQAPTCTSEGLAYRVCTRYPDNPHYEYRILPALSPTCQHDYAIVARTEPTCTDNGTVTYACSICGDTYQETVVAPGHEWGEWTVDREPTENSTGTAHRTCLRDPSHVEYNEIPILQSSAQEPMPVPTAEAASTEVQDATTDAFLTFSPNNLDRTLGAVDVSLVIGWMGASAPLFTPLLWIRSKRSEAEGAYRRKRSGVGGEGEGVGR